MYTRDQILAALKTVIHPDKGRDIVTSGMIGDIQSTESGITITVTPEKPNDPFTSSIKSKIVRSIKETLGPDATVSEIIISPKTVSGKPAEKPRDILPGVRNIIAISSGKGGVGKSTVAVNLAIALARKGMKTGLLDADVFGPSIPIMFDEEDYRPEITRENDIDYIIPLIKYGVKVLSTGFFVDPSEAVIWRGPMASGFLKQMMTQGAWGTLDYLLIDLPPGTSDIHLTLVQEVPVTGVVVISTPQKVAVADAVKGIAMFRGEKINVPVLGLIENMSWFTPAELPENKYYIFGREGGKTLSEKAGVPLLGQIPLVQSICESSDKGIPVALGDTVSAMAFHDLADRLIERVNLRNQDQEPTSRVQVNH